MIFNVYTDGGSRGNPGISGYGLVVLDETGQKIYQEAKFLGIKTNNQAEYLGLIAAITWLKDHYHHYSVSKINFFSDSQLLIRQMQAVYKVKSPELKLLHTTAINLLSTITLPYQFNDIRRESNQLADDLANQAMDQRL